MRRESVKVGDKVGLLTVVEYLGYRYVERDTYRKFFRCVCECGNEVEACAHLLSSGRKRSCGCLKSKIQREKSIIYNIENPQLLAVWRTMKQRCYCCTCKDYRLYGGRGIKIYKAWLDDFYVFNRWAEENGYRKGLMIDRIDNDGDYTPENCKWSTPKEQANNKRTNKYITYNGETHTMKQWCDILGLSYSMVNSRSRRGWSDEENLGFKPHVRAKVVMKSRRKRVIQLSLDGEFIREWDSMYDAAEDLNCNPKYIKKTCLGEQKTYFGFKWKYKI